MSSIDQQRRRDAMAVLARAGANEIAAGLVRFGPLPRYTTIRKPEVGLTMVRGRMGGTGAAFNLGEATVTRAAVRLDDGIEGFAYQLGRDHRKAELAAVVDALWQHTAHQRQVDQLIIEPLRTSQAAAAAARAAAVAGTRVEFFTLQRGED